MSIREPLASLGLTVCQWNLSRSASGRRLSASFRGTTAAIFLADSERLYPKKPCQCGRPWRSIPGRLWAFGPQTFNFRNGKLAADTSAPRKHPKTVIRGLQGCTGI